jgi:hypothetical protein
MSLYNHRDIAILIMAILDGNSLTPLLGNSRVPKTIRLVAMWVLRSDEVPAPTYSDISFRFPKAP